METLASIGFLIARYLHMICSTLIVGGTLFYEMVVPIAIADLSQEQQLAIFARARWVFRQVVWSCAFVLIISGAISTANQWHAYANADLMTMEITPQGQEVVRAPSMLQRADWWWVAHVSTGCIAVFIALGLTIGNRPPTYPIQWMRLNLVVLMVVIFLASVTRQIRMNAADVRNRGTAVQFQYPVTYEESTTTAPTTTIAPSK